MASESPQNSPENLEIGATYYMETRAERLGIVPCVHIKDENGEFVATDEEQKGLLHDTRGSHLASARGAEIRYETVPAEQSFYGLGVLRATGRHEKLADILLVEFIRRRDSFDSKPGFFGSVPGDGTYVPANRRDEGGINSLKGGQVWMRESAFQDLINSGKIKKDRRKSDDPKNMSLERAREVMNDLLQPETLKMRDSDQESGSLSSHHKISSSVARVVAGAHQRIVREIQEEKK